MDIFAKKRIFVLGLGKSGCAVTALLADKGFHVTVSDDDAGKVEQYRASGEAIKKGRMIEVLSMQDYQAAFERSDCLVISPGVPLHHSLVERARSLSIDITGELEVAYRFCPARIIAITGTNGKSTVTDLIGCILETAGVKSSTAGNIGTPLSAVAGEKLELDMVVLEVSSFQLDSIDSFRADIAVLLNVTPDHLDRYDDSFARYAASKGRILNRANQESFFVFNDEDSVCRDFASAFPGSRIPFSSRRSLEQGVFIEGDDVVRRWCGEEEAVIKRSDFTPAGIHNLENALASVAAVTPLNLDKAAIETAMKEYRPLPHRMELVRVEGGVAYINDSKATNVDAAAKSIESIGVGIILIMGGRDKSGDFTVLCPYLERVKKAILIGEAREKIATAISGCCALDQADDMEEAVRKAREIATHGDTVLLAPACASFDMFADYQERGKAFKEAVQKL